VVQQGIASQQALFAQRRRMFDTDGGIAQARFDQVKAQAQGAQDRLDLLLEELGMYESLYKRGFAAKTTLLRLQANAIELRAQAQIQTAALREAELVYRRSEEERTARVLDELRQVQAQLAQVDPELRVVNYSAERNLIRAPLAGRVVGLSVFGPGAVLTPGQKLLEVLPEGRALLVQARVKPADIDDVKVGATAKVRLSTVNPHGKSSFNGRVTTLSADQLPNGPDGKGYYLAQIALDRAELEKAGVALQAGLPATVNITTQKRTLLNYLFSPLGDAFSGAMREE
jgi:HlyD family type I secretion membrane fusion protein